ncbi:MAG: cupredoxin domain-containing protein [Minicystis sp.]
MKTRQSFLRTSLLTLALGALAASCSKPSDAGSSAAPGKDAPATDGRRVDIAVTAEGYTPATVEAKKGESLVLRFTRTVKGECLAQVVFPDQKITKDLPLNTPVEVAIKADKAGKIPFQCGMNMVRGSINVTGS